MLTLRRSARSLWLATWPHWRGDLFDGRPRFRTKRWGSHVHIRSLMNKTVFSFSFSLLLLAATSLTSQAQLIWMCGMNDNGWPLTGTDGGTNANFVQENGAINDLPGSPDSTPDPQGADNDYYFAGIYT